MGNSQSEFNNKELSPQSKQRMIENQLQQERIKNQILEGKLDMLQDILKKNKSR